VGATERRRSHWIVFINILWCLKKAWLSWMAIRKLWTCNWEHGVTAK